MSPISWKMRASSPLESSSGLSESSIAGMLATAVDAWPHVPARSRAVSSPLSLARRAHEISGDRPEARPGRRPRRAQACADRDILSLLAVIDAEPVVDLGDDMTTDEELAPVRGAPVPHVNHDCEVRRRGSPAPERVM